MKKYISLLAATVITFTAAAQMRTSYFMEGSTFRTDMNPALAPTRGYVMLPTVGGIGVGINNNFLSVNNFLYPTDNGLVTFLNKAVDKNDFLNKLPNNNILDVDASVQLMAIGSHTKKFFWNTGINLRATTDVNIPKEFFSLLTTLEQGSYDMSDMRVGLNTYLETYVGAAIPIKDFMTIGFRVKGLIGLAQANMNIDRMNVSINDDKVTAELSGSVRANSVVKSSYQPGTDLDFSDMININGISDLNLKNWGVGIDIGAEARFLDDHLRVSAALTDLGFIKWNGAGTINGSLSGNFSYEGFDFDEGEAISASDFKMQTEESTGSYMKRLNMSLNFGAEYAILRNRISFGLLSHTKFADGLNYTELTASVNLKPVNWITATVSHTFLNHNELGVFGFALNLHPTGFNFFIGADFIGLKAGKLTVADRKIPVPVAMKSANVYMGLGFSLGRAKYSKAYRDDVEAGRIKVKNKKK